MIIDHKIIVNLLAFTSIATNSISKESKGSKTNLTPAALSLGHLITGEFLKIGAERRY
jgi:hypothetical protein